MATLGSHALKRASLQRPDVVVEENAPLANVLAESLARLRTHPQAPAGILDTFRGTIRATAVEGDQSDPYGFERILGESDLVSTNFLARGLKAGRAVCRIRVPTLGGQWYGTGFLVGPGLLATNNHVLGTRDHAAQARAEFGYEHDVDGVLSPAVEYSLAPHEVFFTDIGHDITLVAVTPLSRDGVPLDRFGHLPLVPLSGKGLHGEWVTVIQHPDGAPKQLAIRACQIVDLDPQSIGDDYDLAKNRHLIFYSTDTKPGASGAPVLNDQWQVVAIHHKAVPKPGKENRDRIEKGEEPEWLANEGVRISAISNLLESKRFSDRDAAEAVARIERGLGIEPLWVPSTPIADIREEKDPGAFKPARWTSLAQAKGLGYDPDFIAGLHLPLDAIIAPALPLLAPLKNGSGHVLDYLHFSTVVHKERRFPLLTAVNIRGDKVVYTGGRSGSFRVDARMDAAYQAAGDLYESKLAQEIVYFDRGHLVRRLDPSWSVKSGKSGEAEAKFADEDTFHYSNSAPQVGKFNRGDWGDIEDYVLDRTQMLEKRVTVFTGPIFRPNDPKYGVKRKGGPWLIPASFWKIAVIEKEPGVFAATAFIHGQTKLLQQLYEAQVFTLTNPGLNKLREKDIQTTIAHVSELAALDFSALQPFDAMAALESTERTRVISSLRDIVI